MSFTAVIATYNRPAALQVAIRSALLQVVPPSEVIVVGDCCDERTKNVLEEFSSQKVRYVNLPVRTGSQAIPNAIGTLLAETEFVAYLNHDDAWLPNHLEVASRIIQKTNAPWFLGTARFSYSEKPGPEGQPEFTDITPQKRLGSQAFGRTMGYLEPVSSWVVKKEAVMKAGNWKPAWKTVRPAIVDLALRLYRTSGEPVTTSLPTVLVVWSKTGETRLPAYEEGSLQHEWLAERLMRGKFAWASEIASAQGRTMDREAKLSAGADWGLTSKFPRLARLFSSSHAIRFYSLSGIDLLSLLARMAGIKRGEKVREHLAYRTGETDLHRAVLSKIYKSIRSHNQ